MPAPDAATTPVPVICDLDGVVWLADHAIEGAAEAIARLRAAGHRVLFVSNNSAVRLAEVAAKLERFGIPGHDDVLTSALAAAQLVEPGQRVLLCAGEGAAEALVARGAVLVGGGDVGGGDGHVDAVVVGFHRTFSYEGLRRAAVAVRRGARLIATNDDATYPTPDGPIPGGGAILAAVETGAGVRATVAGKPYEPMAALVRATLGSDVTRAVMVGDRSDTDGRFAVTLGCAFALVLTGVTRPEDLPIEPKPTSIHADLGALVGDLLGSAPDQP